MNAIMNAMGKNVLSGADYDELRRFDLFSNFANDELHRLLRGTAHRTYRRGKVLFVQGDRPEWFFLVLSGRVKLVQMAESGDEGIVDIFGAGQSFGEAAVLTARPFPMGAEVMTDSRLIQVAAEPFLAELARVPALAFKVLANLVRLHPAPDSRAGGVAIQVTASAVRGLSFDAHAVDGRAGCRAAAGR